MARLILFLERPGCCPTVSSSCVVLLFSSSGLETRDPNAKASPRIARSHSNVQPGTTSSHDSHVGHSPRARRGIGRQRARTDTESRQRVLHCGLLGPEVFRFADGRKFNPAVERGQLSLDPPSGLHGLHLGRENCRTDGDYRRSGTHGPTTSGELTIIAAACHLYGHVR